MTRLNPENTNEVLSEQETRISTLIDGEAEQLTECLNAGTGSVTNVVHQYYQYQIIRQTLRGVAITSGAHESLAWNQIRFNRLWARVDGLETD